jgi:hypothetical protein
MIRQSINVSLIVFSLFPLTHDSSFLIVFVYNPNRQHATCLYILKNNNTKAFVKEWLRRCCCCCTIIPIYQKGYRNTICFDWLYSRVIYFFIYFFLVCKTVVKHRTFFLTITVIIEEKKKINIIIITPIFKSKRNFRRNKNRMKAAVADRQRVRRSAVLDQWLSCVCEYIFADTF